jgi:hypothetical protein
LDSRIDRITTIGFGLLLQGILWLIIWLRVFFIFFLFDPRWGHNFAFAIIFITVGLAYYIRKTSCRLVAVASAFLIVPTEMAYWSWETATNAATALFILMIILYAIERTRRTELVSPTTRLRAWLKVHLMNFAYLGLAHMPLIFFVGRWPSQERFAEYLPKEFELPTIVFNLMLLVLAILGIGERYSSHIGRLRVSKIGFVWSILMIVVPLVLLFARPSFG